MGIATHPGSNNVGTGQWKVAHQLVYKDVRLAA